MAAACVAHAVYAWQSIRGRTAGMMWHGFQYLSIGLFCAGSFAAGWARPGWHAFGEMAGAAALGVPLYVAVLHFLLRRW